MPTDDDPTALAYDDTDDELIAKLYTPEAAFECQEAWWMRVEWCDGYEPQAEAEGIRYAQSPLTGTYYRVTEWDEHEGRGKIVAREKHEVDREEVPEVWLAAIDDQTTKTHVE